MPLLQSKTFWIAIAYLTKTVLDAFGIHIPVVSDVLNSIPDGVFAGAGAITMRQAVNKK